MPFKVRIAVVGVEATKSGGTERFTYELVKALGADVFTAKCDPNLVSGGGHKIPRVKGPDIISKNLFPLFAQLLVKSSQYDVIISIGATYLTPSISVAVTSQHATLRLLARDELFLSLGLARKSYWWIRMTVPYILERIIYNRNIPVIAISRLLKDELVKNYKISSDRIYVIYPGVDIEEFKPDPALRARTRSALGLKGDVLLFVGSQWGRKGLKYLIKAITEVGTRHAVSLLVVGGKNEYFGNYPNNVRFLGYRGELCELYNAADVFVFPSLFDAFGLTVLEAMACGIPVVVSRYAGVSEIVGDAGVIINNPRAPQEIIDKILIAKSNREQMSNKARKIAQNYSWAKMGERIKEIWQNLV